MKVERLVVGEIDTNSYLLEDFRELALIDPGGGAEELIKAVKKIGKNLKYIIITHAHPDHTEALGAVHLELGGKIIVHELEAEEVSEKDIRLVKEGDMLDLGNTKLKIIHTPGHTPGSFCLLADKKIFTGDTLFLNGCGRTDLPGGDWQALEKSLIRLEQIIKPGFEVLPGHGETFIVES